MISSSNIIVYQPDFYTTFDYIATNAISLGLYNTQNPYYGCSSGDNDVGAAIYTYEWWDVYHPTTYAHQLIST